MRVHEKFRYMIIIFCAFKLIRSSNLPANMHIQKDRYFMPPPSSLSFLKSNKWYRNGQKKEYSKDLKDFKKLNLPGKKHAFKSSIKEDMNSQPLTESLDYSTNTPKILNNTREIHFKNSNSQSDQVENSFHDNSSLCYQKQDKKEIISLENPDQNGDHPGVIYEIFQGKVKPCDCNKNIYGTNEKSYKTNEYISIDNNNIEKNSIKPYTKHVNDYSSPFMNYLPNNSKQYELANYTISNAESILKPETSKINQINTNNCLKPRKYQENNIFMCENELKERTSNLNENGCKRNSSLNINEINRKDIKIKKIEKNVDLHDNILDSLLRSILAAHKVQPNNLELKKDLLKHNSKPACSSDEIDQKTNFRYLYCQHQVTKTSSNLIQNNPILLSLLNNDNSNESNLNKNQYS